MNATIKVALVALVAQVASMYSFYKLGYMQGEIDGVIKLSEKVSRIIREIS